MPKKKKPRRLGRPRGPIKVRMAPRVTENAADFMKTYWPTLNAGGQYIIEMTPIMVEKAMCDLKGTFNRNELNFILDAFNGINIPPAIAGRSVQTVVANAGKTRTVDIWGVSTIRISNRIKEMDIIERFALEVWATGFWYGSWRDDIPDVTGSDRDRWIERLCA